MSDSADDELSEARELTLAQVAARADVTPGTVRRWVSMGLVPEFDGRWTPAMVAYVRIVARLRARGHSLEQIRHAGENGQLVTGPVENLLDTQDGHYTLKEAARETGLKADMIERIYTTMGLSARTLEPISDADLQMLQYAGAVLDSGFPQVALLQLLRVYGQALAQIADAEVRLFHLYVHEPLMRDGVAGARDRRGDGGPHTGVAAVLGAADELSARPPAGALRRAGCDRAHGGRPRRPVAGGGQAACGDRVRGPRGLRAPDGRARR